MSVLDSFLEQGYTPVGQPRKTIDTSTGKVGYKDNSSLGNMMTLLSSFLAAEQAETDRKMKIEAKKMDMYKTLREANYSPQRAFEAANKGVMPQEAGDEDLNEKTYADKIRGKISRNVPLTSGEQKLYDETIKRPEKAPAVKKQPLSEMIKEKMAAGETLTSGEQKLYDETIKRPEKAMPAAKKLNVKEDILSRISAGNPLNPGQMKVYQDIIKRPGKPVSVKKQDLNDLIIRKVAAGTDLTPGEQKVYDEVIKKSRGLARIPEASDEETVPMTGPDGQPWRIYKSKVQTALKKGYKMRE